MLRYGSRWSSLWAVSAIVLLFGRMLLTRAYRRRSADSDPQVWTDRILVASCFTGFQWGLGAVCLLLTRNDAVELTILITMVAIVSCTGVRGHAYPSAAMLQVSIPLSMFLCVYILEDDWFLAFVTLPYLAYQLSFIRVLGSMNLASIRAEHGRRALLLAYESANAELALANEKLAAIASTDGLTGIRNRRAFDRDIRQKWQDGALAGTGLSLLLIDVDHFKRFNDLHGHPAGDACLVLVATAIKDAVREPSALACRYGGEEFAVTLIDASEEAARQIAHRVASAVAAIDLSPVVGFDVGISVSIGIGSMSPKADASEIDLVSLADRALYRAKADGRNCIRSTGPGARGLRKGRVTRSRT